MLQKQHINICLLSSDKIILHMGGESISSMHYEMSDTNMLQEVSLQEQTLISTYFLSHSNA